jgi:ABC-type nitrate/sulfonate/bicarbonate transport system substrate-binding protein
VSVLLSLLLPVREATGQGAPQSPATIRYAQPFPLGDCLPLYVAREKGLFRQENLNVDVLSLPTGDKQIPALLAGSIDISAYTPDWVVRAVERSDPKTDRERIKVVGGASGMPVYSLVVGKDINGYADLKGKRIAISALKDNDVVLFRRMASANGLRDSDYILIQTGGSMDRAAALKAGSVAAALLIPPLDQRVIDEGYKRLDVSSNVVKQYEWVSHAVREDWAKANRPALVAFLRAWIRATRWIYDPQNKEEAIRILAREMKLEDRYARQAYEMYFDAKTWRVDGVVDLVGLQAVIDAIAEHGDLTPPIPRAEKYVDMSYWQEAMRTLR